MRVLFDISVLGRGFFKNTARTGVFRTIDNLEKIIVNASECDVKLYAFESLKAYLGSYQHLLTYDASNLDSFILAKNKTIFKLSNNIVKYYDRNILSNILITIYLEVFDKFFSSKILPDKFDVFHSTYFPLPQISSTGHAKRFVTIYDIIPLIYPEYFQLKSNHLIKKVVDSIDQNNDFVLCISESTKNDLCNYIEIDPSRVFVTHLAAAKEIFYKATDVAYLEKVKRLYKLPEEQYFLSVSTLEPRKNIEMVIRCFSRLIDEEKIKNLKLVFVGTKGWDYQSIFKEAERSSRIKDNIIFTGYVPDEDLAGIYSRALAFIYPSFYEGFGLPSLEAMQCGLPVITSNRSSLPEVVGDAGIMIDPKCDDELCNYMLEIYKNKSFRKKLASKAIKRAKLFSWDKCAQDTINAYKNALND